MCYSALVERGLRRLPTDIRVKIREQFSDYVFGDSLHSAQAKGRGESGTVRIFPGYDAPVLCLDGNDLVVSEMKYSVDAPPHIKEPKNYTTFNARRDNLTSTFWAHAYRKHHGLVLLDGFCEWVLVKDLLRAGLVRLADVEAEFHAQSEERRKRIEAEGKKYKPTKTELTDPRFRKTVICFRSRQDAVLLVPVIFSETKDSSGQIKRGFAIVTDDPPPEILAAGHDRCPVQLTPQAAWEWLTPKGKSEETLDRLLSERPGLAFTHELVKSA